MCEVTPYHLVRPYRGDLVHCARGLSEGASLQPRTTPPEVAISRSDSDRCTERRVYSLWNGSKTKLSQVPWVGLEEVLPVLELVVDLVALDRLERLAGTASGAYFTRLT